MVLKLYGYSPDKTTRSVFRMPNVKSSDFVLYNCMGTNCILVKRHNDEVKALPKCDGEEERCVIEYIYKCAFLGSLYNTV